jgi:hypothetical protein
MDEERNVVVIKLISGEFVLAEQDFMADVFKNPALIMPTQQGLSLTKFIPFCKYSENEHFEINRRAIVCVVTNPEKSLVKGYEQWIERNRAQESGIQVARPSDVTKLDPIG